MSRVVPKEQLTAYQRWELPALEEQIQLAAERIVRGEDPAGGGLATAAELEDVRRVAFEEGWQEGLARGEAAIAERVAALDEAARQVRQMGAEAEAHLAERLVTVAVALARQVVRREIAAAPESLLVLVRDALAAMPTSEESVRLHLHPDDVAWISDSGNGADPAWQLVADAGIERGGCRVVCGDSTVDATVEARWQQALAAIARSDAWEPPGAE